MTRSFLALALALLAGCQAPVKGTDAPVANTAPALGSVTIGPEDPGRADILTAELGAVVDEDGDEVTLSYAWILKGGVIGTEPTLGPDVVRRGDVIALFVTPSDGTVDGEKVRSNQVTGRNHEPVIERVSISPSALLTDDVATAVVEASDWDGDEMTIRVAWSVNGMGAGGSNTLDGAVAFERGDIVGLTARVDDGQDQVQISAADVVVR